MKIEVSFKTSEARDKITLIAEECCSDNIYETKNKLSIVFKNQENLDFFKKMTKNLGVQTVIEK